MDSLSLGTGLLIGATLGFLFAASRYRAQLATEQAGREARQAAIDREKEMFEAQLAEMKTTFQGLASATLKSSNESFLTLATERMKPLKEELAKLEKETKAMETKRSEAYGSLKTELDQRGRVELRWISAATSAPILREVTVI